MVWVSGLGEVPSDGLRVSPVTWVGRVGPGLTLPSSVLSAEERMNRTDPFDIVACVCVIE